MSFIGIMEEFKRNVLFNKLEYVALFRLNRPVQTSLESVQQFKNVKNNFMEFIQFVKGSNNEREVKWINQLKLVGKKVFYII